MFDFDAEFKSKVMGQRKFVIEIIDWILDVTDRITKKFPRTEDSNPLKWTKIKGARPPNNKKYENERVAQDVDVRVLDKMFFKDYVGKHPKWQPKAEDKERLESVSLFERALEREMIEAFECLQTSWKLPVRKEFREKKEILKRDREHRRY